MNKKIFVLLFTLILPLIAGAQINDTLKWVLRVPHSYDYSVRTPAPKGYKPVLISHYGRHGARYLGLPENYLIVLEPLAVADSLGNLTLEGKKLYQDLKKYYEDECKGREGQLTSIGWHQHETIAKEIYSNYKKVFASHPDVTARCTQYNRCIVSMSAFCLSLLQCDPKLHFYTSADQRDLPIILNENDESVKLYEPGWNYKLKPFLLTIDPMPALRKIFKDPSDLKGKHNFVYNMFKIFTSTDCVDPSVHLGEGIFTDEELEMLYRAHTLRFFDRCSVMRGCARPVLQSIFDEADGDLSSDKPTIRLRFGHDIVILRMLALLNADGFGEMPSSAATTYQQIKLYRIPMACTVLFTFYRKGDSVLVKVLLDGDELLFPIPSVSGPYYDWNEFKKLVQ